MPDASASRTLPRPFRRRRWHLPIAAVLVAGFGTLMLAAVASVLLIGLVGAGRNTYSLLNDKADLALAGVEVRVRHQLDPAVEMAKFVGGLVERGELSPVDRARMTDVLRGTLAGAPDVTGVAFIGADLKGVRVSRQDGVLSTHAFDVRDDKDAPREVFNGHERSGPHWADPLWSREARTTYLALFHPVHGGDGAYAGQVVVAVALADLSRFLSNLFVEQGINAFVLYDESHVLAHPSLAALKFDFAGKGEGPPLPRVDEVDDRPLSLLWARGEPGETLKKRAELRMVHVGGEDILFLMRKMAGYGRQEWTVGIALRAVEVRAEITRLYTMGLGGLAILLVSVGVALWVGRRISQQVGRLAEVADRVRTFDFRSVEDLPDSHLRELSRAAVAFNAMVAGLRWFETYVPKSLVLRLMHRRAEGVLVSEERDVTVMFTDIRGFSRMAEHLGAAETAALLNEHFSRLAACIEAEGGTVDKFIGDAIMAFWGAPDEQHDHAARALRAAHAIATSVREDNRERAADGRPPVRVRIGLHSGPVVVGNIGSVNRINYTIVGDTVNITSRIEELAASLQGEDEVVVLASAATVNGATDAAPSENVGHFPLRGRTETAEVWRLLV